MAPGRAAVPPSLEWSPLLKLSGGLALASRWQMPLHEASVKSPGTCLLTSGENSLKGVELDALVPPGHCGRGLEGLDEKARHLWKAPGKEQATGAGSLCIPWMPIRTAPGLAWVLISNSSVLQQACWEPPDQPPPAHNLQRGPRGREVGAGAGSHIC